jgi:hypothetical protein
MKTFVILLALKAVKGIAICIPTEDVEAGKLPDPLVPFKSGQPTSSCDFLGDVPYGKIPTGCGDLEVLYGMLSPFMLRTMHKLTFSARGTGEPGNLGMVVGDPIHARIERDVGAFINVQGYPVQVRLMIRLATRLDTYV